MEHEIVNWVDFDSRLDLESLNEEFNSANSDYVEIPPNTYIIQIVSLELGLSKQKDAFSERKPMVKGVFKILEGRHENQNLFYNQTVNSPFGMKKAKDFITSLDCVELDDGFLPMATLDKALKIVMGQIKDYTLTYKVKYEKNEKNYPEFNILECYED